eukprot:2782108-Alexandrium_andersonii.AAC.1
MAYRALVITSAIYRAWAKTRLRMMDPWVRSWAPEEAFAGVKGRGAFEAWYGASLQVEADA